jgi:hypothetical protein
MARQRKPLNVEARASLLMAIRYLGAANKLYARNQDRKEAGARAGGESDILASHRKRFLQKTALEWCVQWATQ